MDAVDYVIERVDHGKKDSLVLEFVYLFREVFGKEIAHNFIEWRYFSSPYAGPIMYVARDNSGKLIANYSASAVPMSIDGKVVLSLLSMSTMTHPKYCGKGIFTRLACELYREEKEKFDCIWGFPNANSHASFITKLGWTDLYEVPTKSINFNVISDLKLPKYIVEDDQFSLNYPDQVGLSENISVIKNANYLRWRYRDNPINRYKCFAFTDDGATVKGFAVVKIFGPSLDLLELHGETYEIFDSLLRSVYFYGSKAKKDNLNLWSLPWMKSHPVIERHGAKNALPVTYLAVRGLANKNPALLTCSRNWSIQMGDSDVY